MSHDDPISMQSVRQSLGLDDDPSGDGAEGAGNLFYYLFDDWRSTYLMISYYQVVIHILVCLIILGYDDC